MTYQNNFDTLLDLDGEVIQQAGGYWVKIEVRRVISSDAIPHGIKYSLTLHDPLGIRIMGFDNAHAVKKKYSQKKIRSSSPAPGRQGNTLRIY